MSGIQTTESIDHLFRHHAGQMVSTLCRLFGFEMLDDVEDAVQDSLVAALRKWSYTGIPENPRAWLTAVAKNRLLDKIRRDRWISGESDDILGQLSDDAALEPVYFSGEMQDDQLRMMFACCHPLNPPDAQVALTLKIVGGFSVPEIARAFLAKPESIAKMLTRAKQRLRTDGVQFEIPQPGELSPRLEAVMKVLYLMFNEGYTASEGTELIREDLCHEAIRLCEFLATHPVTAVPSVNALAALFLFQAARFPTRAGDHGNLILLSDQDRSKWDRRYLSRGLEHLRRSARGDKLTEYHLEAEIASCHALAANYEATDWPRILACYDELQCRKFSPIVEINRIVAVEKVCGAEAALNELRRISEDPRLLDYSFFHVASAHLSEEIGLNHAAAASLRTALGLTENEYVRRFLSQKIEVIESIQ
ncbi:MAG TPA: sigma-70 family RNA polymerase sigma factor [Pyrinomonadaceae bacterium]|jgi:RNA polymerase sigma-70 factor (ECF subfamily)|nr:sigma-70 family RNA polymerase sigma factor [Pyrinomonadaceae bacterium]